MKQCARAISLAVPLWRPLHTDITPCDHPHHSLTNLAGIATTKLSKNANVGTLGDEYPYISDHLSLEEDYVNGLILTC
jgi:hypothetical protein